MKKVMFNDLYLYFMLTLIYWAVCVAGCYFLAKSQGRDTTIAAVLGLLFGVFAVIGYLIAGDKY